LIGLVVLSVGVGDPFTVSAPVVASVIVPDSNVITFSGEPTPLPADGVVTVVVFE
jgi:hypothetical protein